MDNIYKLINEFSLPELFTEHKILDKEIEEYRDVLSNSYKYKAVTLEFIALKHQNLEINRDIILNTLKFYQSLTNL
ncbi:hypothetical protein WH52_07160 [Tenacibaculum holothuriorum]|uniref:Uncharacterized protein n=1 Tax=Tenacibaculum holothuriorum TaxID=1635173 RepID=A0A1Y2PDG6_9FLAO|nr:hypothetical protein WH52_07160 [Tenacibaculum holothuriorum]